MLTEAALNHRSMLENLGLGLLALSVALGLISLFVAASPLAAWIQRARPLMLGAMGAGAALLIWSVMLPRTPVAPVLAPIQTAAPLPAPANEPAPSAPPQIAPPDLVPSASVPSVHAPPQAHTPPAVEVTPAPGPAASASTPALVTPPEPQAPAPKSVASPPQQPKAFAGKPASPVHAAPPVEQNALRTPARSSSRCIRLLEKVASGEPMSTQEHNELVSQCQ